MSLTRDAAWQLLREQLHSSNLVKHCLASEAIMRALARRFEADEEAWGITGLLHDIDLDLLGGDLSEHGELGAKLAAKAGLADEYVEAIRLHKHSPSADLRHTTLQHSLAAAETITGLIVATALVYPDKQLASVKPKSIRKRFKEPRFAAGAHRDHILECEAIGLSLDEFIELSLAAMQGISQELGL